jgi:hypothetical protein
VFGKLLIAIRRWLAAQAKNEESTAAPPLDWRKTGDASPPQHWLEAVRRAGPMTRVAAEQQRARRSPNTSLPTIDPHSEPSVADQGTDFRSEPSLSLSPRETAFQSSGPWLRSCLQWVEQTRGGISHAMVHLFRRPLANDPTAAPVRSQPAQTDRTLEMTMTNTAEAGRPQSQTLAPDNNARFDLEDAHQQESVFPTSWSQQHSIVRFPEAARESSFPSLWPHGEKKISDRPVPARGIANVDVENTAPSLDQTILEAWPFREVVRTSLSPIHSTDLLGSKPDPSTGAVYWPELPDSETSAGAEFPPSSGVETTAPRGFPPEIRNSWPELAPDPGTRSFCWRSVLRTLRRSQRLEKEQRGF